MISCSAVGFGGPWEDVRTFAPSLTSVSRLERLTGYVGERTLEALTLGQGDPSNAHHGFFALLAALAHRARTGEGQWIDMSQLEATAGLVGAALMDLEATARCQAHRIAAEPVMGLPALEGPPQFRARGAVRTVRHPVIGAFALYASPIKVSATPGQDRAHGPLPR